MKPYYQDSLVTIYHKDCREVLSIIPSDAAVVTDPPYGMNCNTDSSRFTGGEGGRSLVRKARPIVGDDEPFDPAPWLGFPSVILWGYHHFAQRVPTGTVLIWLKRTPHAIGTFLSDAELAWQNKGHGAYVRAIPQSPQARANEIGIWGAHPTVKPVALMEWCIERVAPTQCVVDPFMGSGTTLAAAKRIGVRSIGVEIEERYCEIAAERCRQEVLDLGGVA